MTPDFAPFQLADGWYFYADEKPLGPYSSMAIAYQRREDYMAYAVTAPGCHCAVPA